MSKNSWHDQSIGELGRRIRAGELSPVELTEHYLARIEAFDKKLNAYRLICSDRALEQAQSAETALRSGKDLGPLYGIPYAAKDLFDVKGLPTSAGSSLLEHNIATEDAKVIDRLSKAGMIFLGKTNTVQFAYSGVGINHDHGTPHNPWSRVPHLPGGSSSGSGVAVAAGLVPMALGTDTGGSVRVPASLCGTVGLKTTVGRISRAGVYPLSWSLDSVGVLSRSVEDAAWVYQCLQGEDMNDEVTWGAAPDDVLKELKDGVREMQFAFAETVFQDDVHAEVDKAVRECGRVFEELGARVSRIEFPEAQEALQLNPGGVVIAAEGYTLNKKWLTEHFDELDPVIAQRMIKGKDVTAEKYLENVYASKRLRARALNRLKNIDALLVPTTPLPAQPVVEVDTTMDEYLKRNALYLRNTCIGNILKFCGLSIPCGFTKQGLPIGLMIYGKPFQENVVLRAGYSYQKITDWHKRTPDLNWIVNQ